jgi:COMPASS component SWD3
MGKKSKTLYQPSTGVLYNWIQSVAFSPDGKTIAAGSSNRSVRVWNVKTGEEIQTQPMRHSEQVIAVAFSPDGQILASGGHDKTIKLWDWKTGKELRASNKQSTMLSLLLLVQMASFSPVEVVTKLLNYGTGELVKKFAL